MEKQLFDWESYDQLDDTVFAFDNVTLKVPIGGFGVGSKFIQASINWETGVLEFYNAGGQVISRFDLEIKVKI